MRTLGHAWLLLSLTLLLGCSRGPGGDALQGDLQTKLDGEFKQGLFEVSEFGRNGHYAFSAEDGSPRLLIYYKARLKLKQDYDFSEWEQLNLNALTSVLGASSEGVKGVNPEGNEAGDEVRVMGTLTYAQDGEGWAPTGLSPRGEASERAAGMDEATPFEKDLAALGQRFKKLENKKKRAHVAAIEEEMARAQRNIGLRLDDLDGIPTLVTGAESGEYHAVGRGLAKVAKATKSPLGHYGSAGSVENCQLVARGLADFAIVQNDVAWLAAQGQGMFARPQPQLRAVCTLYPEAIQVVTLAASGIESIEQLAGKAVNLGPQGSGSRANALLVLQAYGVEAEAGGLAQAGALGIRAAAKALQAGEIDAMFVTTAAPARALEELAAEHPLRFLPIAGAQAERLRGQRGYLAPIQLVRNTYKGLSADVPTLGVTAMVVTVEGTPAERVDTLLKLLFDHSQQLAQHSALAGAINRKTARVGLSLPLHPAAEAALPQE